MSGVRRFRSAASARWSSNRVGPASYPKNGSTSKQAKNLLRVSSRPKADWREPVAPNTAEGSFAPTLGRGALYQYVTGSEFGTPLPSVIFSMRAALDGAVSDGRALSWIGDYPRGRRGLFVVYDPADLRIAGAAE